MSRDYFIKLAQKVAFIILISSKRCVNWIKFVNEAWIKFVQKQYKHFYTVGVGLLVQMLLKPIVAFNKYRMSDLKECDLISMFERRITQLLAFSEKENGILSKSQMNLFARIVTNNSLKDWIRHLRTKQDITCTF